jgi:endonuclease/exonuclease/phosphatase family metal-dependent hydrolase
MTYNISHGEGLDGKLDLARIGAVIESQMPDLVSLQEVDLQTPRSLGIDQTTAIAMAAGMPYYLFGRAIDYAGGEYGVAILSRYPFNTSGNQTLPFSPESEARTALWAEVAVPDIGPVMFVATHLATSRDGQDRVGQAIELVRSFSAAALTPAGTEMPRNIILAGDFNAGANSDTMFILEYGFADAFVGDSLPTFPADAPVRTYDRILLEKNTSFMPVQSWVLDEAVASDHRPVIVDLELPVRRWWQGGSGGE